MPLDFYVLSHDPKKASIRMDELEVEEFLGEQEDAVAVRIQDILESVSTLVSRKIKTNSKLTIELSGVVDIKGKGDVKFLFLNIGGEATSSTTMRVVLETAIAPTGEEEPL